MEEKRMKKQILRLVLFLTLLFSGLGMVSVSAAEIPSDALSFGGHRYKLYNVPSTWYSAKNQCESMGGHLLTITSAQEQSFVEGFLKNGTKNFYWMGARRDSYGGFSKWITDEAITYTHYDRGEPNNYLGHENVLVIFRLANPRGGDNGQMKWNDLREDGECNGETFFGKRNSGFICEWDTAGISIAKASVKLSKSTYVYDGKAKKPSVTVTLNGKKLKKGTDYNVTYAGASQLGTATVHITGTGKYTGMISRRYTIKLATPSFSVSSTRNGEVVVSSKLVTGASGFQIEYQNKTTKKWGTKTVPAAKGTITGLHAGRNYLFHVRAYAKRGSATYYSDYSGFKTKKIYTGKSVAKLTITLSQTKYLHDGNAKKPIVRVKDGKKSLTRETDYTVSYKNNVNAGRATVTIRGKGKYGGTATRTFIITPLPLSKCSVTLPQGTEYNYTGNAVEPAVSVKYNGKQVPYRPSSTFTLKYTDNVKSGTAKVTVRGVGNLSGIRELTFTIKAALVSPVPSGAKFSRQTKDEGTNWYGYHDINRNVTSSTPVYAITNGTITLKQAHVGNMLTSYGNWIEFVSDPMPDGTVYRVKYAHLSKFNYSDIQLKIPYGNSRRQSGGESYVIATKKVSVGDTIGFIGTSGNSSGIHLHIEIYKNGKRVDPTSVFPKLAP